MTKAFKTLYTNVILPNNYGFGKNKVFIAVTDNIIDYVGTSLPKGEFDKTVDCRENLMIPAFYNSHCHAAMTALRGYGENLPLDRWLNEKIFPAEDKLDESSVYAGSMLAVAEMIGNGIVSFSDMYMFCPETAKAVLETGMKANISRGVVSFSPSDEKYPEKNSRIQESIALYNEYNNAGNGRIKIDFGIHAEYTNCENVCRYVARLAKEYGSGVHLHLSETAKEHEECIERYGMTPTAFFEKCGVFENRTYAAHCVFVSDEDIRILKKHMVYAVHNPQSNLKLGSGIMPLKKLLDNGVTVAIGTDGASSNNSLSILKELQLAAVLHKGCMRAADIIPANEILSMSSRNGALSQGRNDCGLICQGFKADMVLINLDTPHNIPCYDPSGVVCYSADNADILMTICDGKVLYENGEYKTLDVEKVKYDARKSFKIFG